MKVSFNASMQSVCIEGDGPELIKLLELVRDIAPNLPQISIHAETAGSPQRNSQLTNGQLTNGQISNGDENHAGGETLRQFARKIPLTSNAEKIAAIAYYKKNFEKADVFTPKEMGEWFTMCGFAKPQQMPVAVHTAKTRNGYVESASHGQWRLSTNGLNLVVGKLNRNGEDDALDE